jgi:hypothetical protein
MSLLDVTFGAASHTALLDKFGQQFPDPFLDMASQMMPRTLRQVLDLCEFIWLKNSTYRQAAGRIVRYFITRIEMDEVSEQVEDKIRHFLEHQLRVVDQLSMLGDDFMAYGNSFSSVVLPFRRFLRCKVAGCGYEQPIEQARWAYKSHKFTALCRRCKKMTDQDPVDRRSVEEDRVKIKRWSPKQIRLLWHPWSWRYEYFWEVPADFRNEVNKGTPFYVQDTPLEVLRTIKENRLFKFSPGVVYHMHEDTLSGIETKGWGVTRLLPNFAQAWYVQVLKRYNEALALDYVVPFRVITPKPLSSANDPMIGVSLGEFKVNVQRMLREHRIDPATWHNLPFPIEYQALGGEAKNLATPELIDSGLDELLNGIGIPAELYRATLNIQALPVALRLFQQNWPHLVNNYNGWLNWMMEIVSTAFNWDKPDRTYLQPVTMADDLETKQMIMQMALANIISKETAFSMLGIDARAELKKMFREQKEYYEEQQQMQEDQMHKQELKDTMSGQAAQGGGGAPPGMGGPAQAGMSNQAMTPMDLAQQAEQLAGQLVKTPYETRRGMLMEIKQSNPTLHALVKAKLQDLRQDAASQGKQQMLGGG